VFASPAPCGSPTAQALRYCGCPQRESDGDVRARRVVLSTATIIRQYLFMVATTRPRSARVAASSPRARWRAAINGSLAPVGSPTARVMPTRVPP